MKRFLVRSFIVIGISFSSLTQAIEMLDCVRPMKKIFTGYTTSGSKIYIQYSDGFSVARMRMEDINNDEEIVNRVLSILMAGHVSGRTVISRYSGGEDGSAPSCTPSVDQKLISAWIE